MNRILILNWRCPKNPFAGGAEKVTLKHASYWAKKGFQIYWLTGKEKGLKRVEKIDGVKIYRFGNLYTIYFLAPFVYWLKFKGKFDLVIDQAHWLPFLSPFWAFRSKRILFIHETAQKLWGKVLPVPLNFLARSLEKTFLRFYKKTTIWTVSKSTKKQLIELGLSPSQIYVIPNASDLPFTRKIPSKFKGLTLAFISRLTKLKGAEEALEIVKILKSKVKDVKLYIAGRGEKKYGQFLKNQAKKLKVEKNVKFLGFISEKQKLNLLQKSHFLLHPSFHEGFGLTVIEANSQATPVIAYKSPGLEEIVKNGINGYKFLPTEKKEIVKKILFLYKNKTAYLNLARSSLKFASQFSWEKSTEKSLELIKKVLKKK